METKEATTAGEPVLPPSSTQELANAFALSAFRQTLTVGPTWNSFEQFRKAGPAALAGISEHGVGVLRTKAGTFRILREADFQRLIGMASEVSRLQQGVKIVQNAAKVLIKHPDTEHLELLIRTASMIAESTQLGQGTGHEPLSISEQQSGDDDFDFSKEDVPRPAW